MPSADGKILLINDPVGGKYVPSDGTKPVNSQLKNLIPLVFTLSARDLIP